MKADNIVRLASALIEIPSETGNIKACHDVLEAAQKELKGISYKKYEKNGVESVLYYNGAKVPKKFKIILNAHLDVVPAKPAQFKPYVKNGKLFGRGALDMKSAAAAMILVFKECAEWVPYPLGLQLVTDEETGGHNGVRTQVEKGIVANFVIAGEPTNLNMNIESKGIIWFDAKADGKSAHGAFPWEGVNAIEHLNNFIYDLKALYPTPKKDTWQTTVNVSRISSSNSAMNKVPDSATAGFDVRFIPADHATVRTTIKKLAKKHNMSLHYYADDSHQSVSSNNPYVTMLVKHVQKNTGTKPHFVQQHYGSDMRIYTATGVSSVCFGPGGGGMHQDTEWVSIDSLLAFYEVLTKFTTES